MSLLGGCCDQSLATLRTSGASNAVSVSAAGVQVEFGNGDVAAAVSPALSPAMTPGGPYILEGLCGCDPESALASRADAAERRTLALCTGLAVSAATAVVLPRGARTSAAAGSGPSDFVSGAAWLFDFGSTGVHAADDSSVFSGTAYLLGEAPGAVSGSPACAAGCGIADGVLPSAALWPNRDSSLARRRCDEQIPAAAAAGILASAALELAALGSFETTSDDDMSPMARSRCLTCLWAVFSSVESLWRLGVAEVDHGRVLALAVAAMAGRAAALTCEGAADVLASRTRDDCAAKARQTAAALACEEAGLADQISVDKSRAAEAASRAAVAGAAASREALLELSHSGEAGQSVLALLLGPDDAEQAINWQASKLQAHSSANGAQASLASQVVAIASPTADAVRQSSSAPAAEGQDQLSETAPSDASAVWCGLPDSAHDSLSRVCEPKDLLRVGSGAGPQLGSVPASVLAADAVGLELASERSDRRRVEESHRIWCGALGGDVVPSLCAAVDNDRLSKHTRDHFADVSSQYGFADSEIAALTLAVGNLAFLAQHSLKPRAAVTSSSPQKEAADATVCITGPSASSISGRVLRAKAWPVSHPDHLPWRAPTRRTARAISRMLWPFVALKGLNRSRTLRFLATAVASPASPSIASGNQLALLLAQTARTGLHDESAAALLRLCSTACACISPDAAPLAAMLHQDPQILAPLLGFWVDSPAGPDYTALGKAASAPVGSDVQAPHADGGAFSLTLSMPAPPPRRGVLVSGHALLLVRTGHLLEGIAATPLQRVLPATLAAAALFSGHDETLLLGPAAPASAPATPAHTAAVSALAGGVAAPTSHDPRLAALPAVAALRTLRLLTTGNTVGSAALAAEGPQRVSRRLTPGQAASLASIVAIGCGLDDAAPAVVAACADLVREAHDDAWVTVSALNCAGLGLSAFGLRGGKLWVGLWRPDWAHVCAAPLRAMQDVQSTPATRKTTPRAPSPARPPHATPGRPWQPEQWWSVRAALATGILSTAATSPVERCGLWTDVSVSGVSQQATDTANSGAALAVEVASAAKRSRGRQRLAPPPQAEAAASFSPERQRGASAPLTAPRRPSPLRKRQRDLLVQPAQSLLREVPLALASWQQNAELMLPSLHAGDAQSTRLRRNASQEGSSSSERRPASGSAASSGLYGLPAAAEDALMRGSSSAASRTSFTEGPATSTRQDSGISGSDGASVASPELPTLGDLLFTARQFQRETVSAAVAARCVWGVASGEARPAGSDAGAGASALGLMPGSIALTRWLDGTDIGTLDPPAAWVHGLASKLERQCVGAVTGIARAVTVLVHSIGVAAQASLLTARQVTHPHIHTLRPTTDGFNTKAADPPLSSSSSASSSSSEAEATTSPCIGGSESEARVDATLRSVSEVQARDGSIDLASLRRSAISWHAAWRDVYRARAASSVMLRNVPDTSQTSFTLSGRASAEAVLWDRARLLRRAIAARPLEWKHWQALAVVYRQLVERWEDCVPDERIASMAGLAIDSIVQLNTQDIRLVQSGFGVNQGVSAAWTAAKMPQVAMPGGVGSAENGVGLLRALIAMGRSKAQQAMLACAAAAQLEAAAASHIPVECTGADHTGVARAALKVAGALPISELSEPSRAHAGAGTPFQNAAVAVSACIIGPLGRVAAHAMSQALCNLRTETGITLGWRLGAEMTARDVEAPGPDDDDDEDGCDLGTQSVGPSIECLSGLLRACGAACRLLEKSARLAGVAVAAKETFPRLSSALSGCDDCEDDQVGEDDVVDLTTDSSIGSEPLAPGSRGVLSAYDLDTLADRVLLGVARPTAYGNNDSTPPRPTHTPSSSASSLPADVPSTRSGAKAQRRMKSPATPSPSQPSRKHRLVSDVERATEMRAAAIGATQDAGAEMAASLVKAGRSSPAWAAAAKRDATAAAEGCALFSITARDAISCLPGPGGDTDAEDAESSAFFSALRSAHVSPARAGIARNLHERFSIGIFASGGSQPSFPVTVASAMLPSATISNLPAPMAVAEVAGATSRPAAAEVAAQFSGFTPPIARLAGVLKPPSAELMHGLTSGGLRAAGKLSTPGRAALAGWASHIIASGAPLRMLQPWASLWQCAMKLPEMVWLPAEWGVMHVWAKAGAKAAIIPLLEQLRNVFPISAASLTSVKTHCWAMASAVVAQACVLDYASASSDGDRQPRKRAGDALTGPAEPKDPVVLQTMQRLHCTRAKISVDLLQSALPASLHDTLAATVHLDSLVHLEAALEPLLAALEASSASPAAFDQSEAAKTALSPQSLLLLPTFHSAILSDVPDSTSLDEELHAMAKESLAAASGAAEAAAAGGFGCTNAAVCITAPACVVARSSPGKPFTVAYVARSAPGVTQSADCHFSLLLRLLVVVADAISGLRAVLASDRHNAKASRRIMLSCSAIAKILPRVRHAAVFSLQRLAMSGAVLTATVPPPLPLAAGAVLLLSDAPVTDVSSLPSPLWAELDATGVKPSQLPPQRAASMSASSSPALAPVATPGGEGRNSSTGSNRVRRQKRGAEARSHRMPWLRPATSEAQEASCLARWLVPSMAISTKTASAKGRSQIATVWPNEEQGSCKDIAENTWRKHDLLRAKIVYEAIDVVATSGHQAEGAEWTQTVLASRIASAHALGGFCRSTRRVKEGASAVVAATALHVADALCAMAPEALAKIAEAQSRQFSAPDTVDRGLLLLKSVLAFALRDCAGLLEMVRAAWPMVAIARHKASIVVAIAAQLNDSGSAATKRPTPGYLPDEAVQASTTANPAARLTQATKIAAEAAAVAPEESNPPPKSWESVFE